MRRFPWAIAALLTVSCAESQAPIEPQDSSEERELEASIARVEAGDLSGGLRALEELRNADSPDVRLEALRWLGHAHTRNKDPEAALAAYRAGLLLGPDDEWLHYASGTAQLTMGDLEAAISSYSSALAVDDSHLKSLQWRGHCFEVLERYDEAIADFERALALLESATPEAVADWGGDRDELLEWTRRELESASEALQGSGGTER